MEVVGLAKKSIAKHLLEKQFIMEKYYKISLCRSAVERTTAEKMVGGFNKNITQKLYWKKNLLSIKIIYFLKPGYSGANKDGRGGDNKENYDECKIFKYFASK